MFRYDGRGHLHDLRDFEQSGWNEDNQLSKEAARIEAICDEERYMALHTDLLEEQHRHGMDFIFSMLTERGSRIL